MSIGLTKRQSDALRFIRGYQEAHGGISPGFREIAAAMSCGQGHTETATTALTALEERGHLRQLPNRARAIEVLTDIPIPRSPTGEPLYFVEVRG